MERGSRNLIALLLFLGVLFTCIAIRIPIFICLGVSAISLWLLSFGTIDSAVYIQQMFTGLNSFTLMAIPFFMLCGELMNLGGLTKRLVVFIQDATGWIRGGLGYAVTLAGVFIAAILGSASASAAILGSTMIPEMKEKGYQPNFSAALIAASGTLGPIIPPSTIYIIYGVIAGVSITDMFLAGYLPGLIIATLFMVYTYIHVKKNNYPTSERPRLITIIKSLIKALPTFFLPILIMGGIISGVFTPTEAGVISVFYALIIGLLYKDIKLNDIPKALLRAATKTGMILIVIASAKLLAYVLTIEQIPQLVASLILGLSINKHIFLMMVIFLLLILGCFMDTISALTIVTPVLLPIAVTLGIDKVYLGIIMGISITIGNITPPVGMNLYVTSAIAEIDILRLSRSCVPFCILLVIALAIFLIFPKVITIIPSMLH